MNYREHEPAHFHARYQGYEISMEIETGIVRGEMPRRALKLLFEWAELHRDELLENWHRAQQHSELLKIEPLN